MKKIYGLLAFLIALNNIVFAQFITSPSANFSLPTVYTNGTPNDVIYGFCTPNNAGAAVTGSLTATAGIANCTFTWTIFDPVTNTYNPFTTQAGLTTSTLTGLASGGYHVTITNGAGTVVGCDVAWVWVNQTTATVAPIASGCSAFTLNGTASAVSNYTYYNPPPEPFVVSATTTISVGFSATHTFVSDLGFFLVGPATCGSPTVTLSPNPGANGQGSVCNSGDNVNNLVFTTAAAPNFDPCAAAAPYTGTYDSYGPTSTTPNWSSVYGCDASEGGWSVQIYDCIGADVGALTNATISFTGNSGCGASTINYNSGAISSTINDNSCSSATASIYTVPNSVAVPIVLTSGNTVTYQWTSVPASAIPNSTTSLTPNINPVPTVDTWYYLTVTDNYGCVKKDSAFFDYTPAGVPNITPAGPFCANAAATNLTADIAGGTWSGTGITNAVAGTFNPATAGVGTHTITYTTPGACGGSNTTTITVNALPTVTVPASFTVCNTAAVAATNFVSNPVGATFDWVNTNTSIGIGANGTGNIAGFNAVNLGSTVQTAAITVTPTLNGCVGTPSSYTITVNPTPSLTAVASQTVCNTVNTAAITFASTPAGATVNWTNSNTAIGIGAGAAGNIAAFTGTNATAAQISGNFSATPTLNTCVGAAITFTISVDPTPVLTAVPSETLCAGASTTAINFTTNPVGATVNWTNTNTGIGIGAGAAGNIASFTATNAGAAAIQGDFSATPTLNGCVGAAQTFTIVVNPIPSLSAVTSETVCAGNNTTAVNFTTNPVGATVNWTNTNTAIGIGAGAAGNIASVVATNATASPISGDFSASPTLAGCTGSAITFTITVNPLPVLTAIASQTLCAGASTTAINFVTNPAGATIGWTNSNTAIGIGAANTGDIASFVSTNGGATQISGNFSAVPTLNGCVGVAETFTISVDPLPVLTAVASQTVCEGVATTAVNYVSTVAGTSINWVNTNSTTGLALAGNGNIPSFTGLNGTATTQTSVITATPTTAAPASCLGSAITFTIAVDPTPTLSSVTSQTVCEGLPTTAINFSLTPVGVGSVNWTNSATAIGQPAVGTGDIASYNAANGTGAIVNAAFVATPVIGTCAGTSQNFTITVNPAVTANAVASYTLCNTATAPASAFTSTPAGATYVWNNSDNSIGLGSNGSGDYASFTANNLTTNPVSATITVTPTLNTCVGPNITYTITVNPTPAPPGVSNIAYCLNDVSSPLTATPAAGGTLNWWGTSAAGGTSTANGPTPPTNAVATTNYYVSQTVLGCESPRAQIQVIVNTLPSITDPGDFIVCAGDAVPLQAFTSTPAGATINWANDNANTGLSTSGVGDVSAFTAANSTLGNIVSGITVVPTIGTCVGASITYSITVKPLPTVAVTSTTACNNASIGAITWASTPPGATYTWVNSDASIGVAASGVNSIPAFTAINNGSTTVIASITVDPVLNGCNGPNSTFSITVNPTPPAPTVVDPVYCVNDAPSVLSATGTALLWYTTATGGAGSSLTPTPSTGTAATTLYYVTQTLLTCESPRAQLSVLVNPLPTGTLVSIPKQCPPLCTDVVLNSVSNLVDYSWTLGDGATYLGNDTVPNHCYNTPGTYTVSVVITDNNGCVKSLTFPNAVQVSELPVAQFTYGPQPTSILNPTINFTDISVGLQPMTNAWNFGDSLGTALNDNVPVYTYANSGTYLVRLITANALGCLDTAYNTVVIDPDFVLYVPNAFSPNSDGVNDVFYPKGLGIHEKGFKMYIFDRWGNQLFFTEDINKGWEGKVQGKDNLVQQDTYVWKISCKSEAGHKIEKSGHVTVVR